MSALCSCISTSPILSVLYAGIISRPQDSLFTYSQGTSFSTFHNPLFTPTFTTTFTDPALEVRALAICGDDRFCLFDIAATGSTEIGLSTLMGDIEFQTIVNRSLPGEGGGREEGGDKNIKQFHT